MEDMETIVELPSDQTYQMTYCSQNAIVTVDDNLRTTDLIVETHVEAG